MIFIPIFSAVYTLVLFLIKIVSLYFLIKIFDKKIKFSVAFKILIFYEIIAFFILSLYSSFLEGGLLYHYGGNLIAFLFFFLLLFLILFLIFKFLLQKFALLNWRRALIIFIALNLIMPSVSFILTIATKPISEIPIFQKEVQEMEMMDYLFHTNMFVQKYTILSIIWKIQNSLIGIIYYLNRFLINLQGKF
jgi:hypothetical protein